MLFCNLHAYPLLVVVNFIVSNGVGLGNDGNQVDFGVELLHNLNVNGLQRVPGGLDEVDDSVNTVVDNVHTVDLVLGIQVGVKTLLDVLDNRVPGLIVVDEVTKAGCIDYRQPQTDTILFNVCADRLDRDGLGDVQTRRFALLRRI